MDYCLYVSLLMLSKHLTEKADYSKKEESRLNGVRNWGRTQKLSLYADDSLFFVPNLTFLSLKPHIK